MIAQGLVYLLLHEHHEGTSGRIWKTRSTTLYQGMLEAKTSSQLHLYAQAAAVVYLWYYNILTWYTYR